MEKQKTQTLAERSFEEQSLQEVMDIERAAQNVIHNAEVESQQIIQTAKTQAEAMQADELDKWRKANDAKLEEFRRQVDMEAQAIRSEEQTRTLEWLERAKRNKKHAVDFAVKAVLLEETAK